MRAFALTALLCCGIATAAASDDDANPIVGEWDWNPTGAVCPEVHEYRADGTASTRSGEEVLEKTYTVSAAGGGMFLVEMTVVSSNGGKDCLGKPTPAGASSSVYVMPINGGGFYTCASEDTMSCFGSARPRAKAKTSA